MSGWNECDDGWNEECVDGWNVDPFEECSISASAEGPSYVGENDEDMCDSQFDDFDTNYHVDDFLLGWPCGR